MLPKSVDFIFLKIYLFIFWGEQPRGGGFGGKGQRQRETETLADSTLRIEPNAGLHLATLRSDLRENQELVTLNRLHYLGAPAFIFI